MLILTRRIDETVYIGDNICVTVYDKFRFHIMIGVLAPPDIPVVQNGVAVKPAVLEDGGCFYLLTLLSHESFAVGDAKVSVAFKPVLMGLDKYRMRQVRIAIAAPKSVEVDREEIHVRKLASSGRHPPALTVSQWLRKADVAVSRRLVA